MLSIVFGVYKKFMPVWSLMGLVTVVIAVPTFIGAYRFAEDINRLMPYMGLNVLINISTPVLVATGLFMG